MSAQPLEQSRVVKPVADIVGRNTVRPPRLQPDQFTPRLEAHIPAIDPGQLAFRLVMVALGTVRVSVPSPIVELLFDFQHGFLIFFLPDTAVVSFRVVCDS